VGGQSESEMAVEASGRNEGLIGGAGKGGVLFQRRERDSSTVLAFWEKEPNRGSVA